MTATGSWIPSIALRARFWRSRTTNLPPLMCSLIVLCTSWRHLFRLILKMGRNTWVLRFSTYPVTIMVFVVQNPTPLVTSGWFLPQTAQERGATCTVHCCHADVSGAHTMLPRNTWVYSVNDQERWMRLWMDILRYEVVLKCCRCWCTCIQNSTHFFLNLLSSCLVCTFILFSYLVCIFYFKFQWDRRQYHVLWWLNLNGGLVGEDNWSRFFFSLRLTLVKVNFFRAFVLYSLSDMRLINTAASREWMIITQSRF